jgi:hypothetical protein
MLSWKKPALWEIYGDLLVTSSCKLLITSYITIYKAQTNYSENPTFSSMLCYVVLQSCRAHGHGQESPTAFWPSPPTSLRWDTTIWAVCRTCPVPSWAAQVKTTMQGCGLGESTMGIEKNKWEIGTWDPWMVYYWKGPNVGLPDPQSLTRPCANSCHTTFISTN